MLFYQKKQKNAGSVAIEYIPTMTKRAPNYSTYSLDSDNRLRIAVKVDLFSADASVACSVADGKATISGSTFTTFSLDLPFAFDADASELRVYPSPMPVAVALLSVSNEDGKKAASESSRTLKMTRIADAKSDGLLQLLTKENLIDDKNAGCADFLSESSYRGLYEMIRSNPVKAVISPVPSGSAPSEPGRNEPCFCGSGRKFKVCHQKIKN